MQFKKKVLAIVVTYNAEKWLDTCLESLIESDYPLQIALVDNNSTDGTLRVLKERFEGKVHYLFPLKTNLGFGKAHNLVFEKCDMSDYEYVFLLNQDAAISRTGISQLIDVAQKYPDYGVLSPVHFYKEGVLDRNFSKYYQKNHKKIVTTNGYTVREVEFVNAAIWLMRVDILRKIGGFDPLFSHYGEDSNYIHRLQYAGYRTVIAEGVVGYHYRSQIVNGEKIQKSDQKFYISTLVNILNPSHSFTKQVLLSIGRAALRAYEEAKCGNYEMGFSILNCEAKLVLSLPKLLRSRSRFKSKF